MPKMGMEILEMNWWAKENNELVHPTIIWKEKMRAIQRGQNIFEWNQMGDINFDFAKLRDLGGPLLISKSAGNTIKFCMIIVRIE